MSRIKEKVTGMNPKRGFCNLILCLVIFCIAAGIGTGVRFGSRITEMRSQMEVMEKSDENVKQDFRNEEKGREGKEQEHERKQEMDWENFISLTTGDYVFLGCVLAAFWIILCIYWLYTTAYAVSKSWQVGANAWLFGLLTLVTNLFGVLCLWIYIKLHLLCPNCGKMQPRKANYCSVCGTAIYAICPDCGNRVPMKDEYCNGCGRKMHLH